MKYIYTYIWRYEVTLSYFECICSLFCSCWTKLPEIDAPAAGADFVKNVEYSIIGDPGVKQQALRLLTFSLMSKTKRYLPIQKRARVQGVCCPCTCLKLAHITRATKSLQMNESGIQQNMYP